MVAEERGQVIVRQNKIIVSARYAWEHMKETYRTSFLKRKKLFRTSFLKRKKLFGL